MMAKHTRERQAFSLVELLVVIGILSLFISLTLPGMLSSRHRAESVVCTGNLKNIYTAAMMYEDDYDGHMPTPYQRDGGIEGYWLNTLAPYLSLPSFSSFGGYYGPPIGPSTWTCPSQYRQVRQSFTYSENHHLNMQFSPPPGAERGLDGLAGPTKRIRVLRAGVDNDRRWPVGPHTLPYFMDGWYHMAANLFTSWRAWQHRGPFFDYSFPHDGGCNMVFLDGHAEQTNLGDPIWTKSRPAYRSGGHAW
jgi:prepilin-type processing-associated H-X9-DG protein/prepilin-type N-terminal cleavage/methylation domain-containing protein